MKSKVRLSTYSLLLTLILDGVMIAGCIVTYREKAGFYTLLGIFFLMVVMAMLYAPVAIKADEAYVTVVSVLRRHRIPVGDIESVELFQPTMGAIRVCASGGYMGYWGIFREWDIGRYMAYYGKASDCFLIRMRNGDKYVLGCDDPAAMVEYLHKLHCNLCN